MGGWGWGSGVESQELAVGHDAIFVETAGRVQPAGSLHSQIFDHVLGAFLGHCVPRHWVVSFPGLGKVPMIGHSMLFGRPCEAKVSGPYLSY